MDRKKLLVSGASVAFGAGLPREKRDKSLWANSLAEEIDYDITNVSIMGIDNQEIFFQTLGALSKNPYDLIIVQWQTIPHKNVTAGFEKYNTRFNLFGVQQINDLSLVSDQVVKAKKIIDFRDHVMKYYKEHWEIRELIYYCNVLSKLATCYGANVKFLNFNMPWKTDRYFDFKFWRVPSDLDLLTQSILDVDLRDDDEVRDLYVLMHLDYSDAGSIDESKWLNLYDPLNMHQIDRISHSDRHPGFKSQEIFKDLIISWLL
jgi:hypothetical protein